MNIEIDVNNLISVLEVATVSLQSIEKGKGKIVQAYKDAEEFRQQVFALTVSNDLIRKERDELRANAKHLMEAVNEVKLSDGTQKLAYALADAVGNELQGIYRDEPPIFWEQFHTTVLKYAERYFSNAQDTEKKLAEAFEELHVMRARAHKERIEGMEAITNIAAAFAKNSNEKYKATGGEHFRFADMLDCMATTLKLNQARSEDVDDKLTEAV